MSFDIPLRIIIITHLGDDVLLRCIQSIQESTLSAETVVLVSNEKDQKLSLPSKITVHQFRENIGYARAVNFAFEHYGTQPLLIMNDDIVLEKDCLERLWRAYSPEQIIQPQIHFYDAPSTIENAGHRIRIDGANEAYSRGESALRSKKTSRICFSGAAFVISPIIIKKIGLFDPDLSPFGEDLDYSLRVIRHGFQIAVIPEAIMYHKLGHSFGRFSRQKIIDVEAYRIQARLRSFPLLLTPLAPISTLSRYWRGRHHSLVPVDRKTEAIQGALLGIIKGYASLPRAIRKRNLDTHTLSDWKFIVLLLKQPRS